MHFIKVGDVVLVFPEFYNDDNVSYICAWMLSLSLRIKPIVFEKWIKIRKNSCLI